MQKRFNRPELEDGNGRQNFKEATVNASKIFSIVLHAFHWLACFKYVIVDHSPMITLNSYDVTNTTSTYSMAYKCFSVSTN